MYQTLSLIWGIRKKYVVHYCNLQLNLKLVMKFSKVLRILGFNENHWMKSYIQLNTEMRKKSKSVFEKDFQNLRTTLSFAEQWRISAQG